MSSNTLCVAGCSFSTPSKTHPETHFSELLSNSLELDLENYSREGLSNGGIRIAIDEIIRLKPFLAIIVPTFPGRIEIPRQGNKYDWENHRPSVGWAPPLENHIENKYPESGYQQELGIKNINYGQTDYNFISETLFSLAESLPSNYRAPISKDAKHALKGYVNFIYDKKWKEQTDKWIISQGVTQLADAGINFLVMPGFLWKDKTEIFKYIPSTVDKKHILTNQIDPLYCANLYPLDDFKDDPGYHTSAQAQQHLATVIEEYIFEQQII